jgi:hypothetical protein
LATVKHLKKPVNVLVQSLMGYPWRRGDDFLVSAEICHGRHVMGEQDTAARQGGNNLGRIPAPQRAAEVFLTKLKIKGNKTFNWSFDEKDTGNYPETINHHPL